MKRDWFIAVGIGIEILVGGCGRSPASPTKTTRPVIGGLEPAESLTIQPDTDTIPLGGKEHFSFVVTWGAGIPPGAPFVSWSSNECSDCVC
jgi:hypothetical protein